MPAGRELSTSVSIGITTPRSAMSALSALNSAGVIGGSNWYLSVVRMHTVPSGFILLRSAPRWRARDRSLFASPATESR